MNYQDQVLAVYPDAECRTVQPSNDWPMTRFVIWLNDFKLPKRPYVISARSEERAWQAASEKMDREYE